MRKATSLAQPDDTGDVQRARTHAALVAAAVDNWDQLHARVLAAHIDCAGALWAIELVAGDRGDVDVHFVDVDGNLADCLHRVGVEDHAALATELADFGDWLQHA